MRKKCATLMSFALGLGIGAARADFKYTESAKMTGGMMGGMMKMAGAFSKQAREPMVSTISVKGRRLRTEYSDGKVHLIDLDGRRIIDLDTQKRTYSVVTFDEMRAAIQDAQEKAKKQAHEKGGENANVKVVPKIQVTPTGNTRVILDQPAKEVKVRLDMEVQSDDPKQQGQTASYWFTSDAWVAPGVKGHEEVTKFYERMAKELNWVPGAMLGGNPEMANAMVEFRKNTSAMEGFPLVQNTSFGFGVPGQPATAGGGSQPPATTIEPQPSQSSQAAATPGGAAAKAIGGVLGGFGGFGKKKKKEPATQESSSASAAPGSSQPATTGASNSASLMDMTVEVTSFSNDALDASLFEIPAGYTQVQGDSARMLGGRR